MNQRKKRQSPLSFSEKKKILDSIEYIDKTVGLILAELKSLNAGYIQINKNLLSLIDSYSKRVVKDEKIKSSRHIP